MTAPEYGSGLERVVGLNPTGDTPKQLRGLKRSTHNAETDGSNPSFGTNSTRVLRYEFSLVRQTISSYYLMIQDRKLLIPVKR